jgi:outer membrane biosynthesis protein TonB
MPIFRYFSIAGAVLLALLFLADARFERHGPLAISSNFEGLPKPWKPELNPPLPPSKPTEIQVAAAPAPALDSKQNEPKPVEVATAPPPAAPAKQVAKPEPAPKKQRYAARKQPRREDREAYAQHYTQHYAWRHDGNGYFGGGGWRF